MKKTLVVLFVACVAIVTLLAVIDLEPYFAPKKEQPQAPSVASIDDTTKQNIEQADVQKKLAKPSADPAVIATNPPLADETAKPIAASETADSAKIDARPLPVGKIVPEPAPSPLPNQVESQAKLSASQVEPEVSKLPTDTAKTPENQVTEPHSAQVTASSSKPVEQGERNSPTVHPVKKTYDMEIALTPENNYPFSILLETLDDFSTAQQSIDLYRKQGLAAFWVKVNWGNSGVKYRVFIGMFPAEATARSFVNQHHLKGKSVEKTPYAARIGAFHDKKELALAFVKTSKSGSFPYILGTESGPYFLYVGAFSTTTAAARQCRELVAKGIPCEAVTRSTLPQKKF